MGRMRQMGRSDKKQTSESQHKHSSNSPSNMPPMPDGMFMPMLAGMGHDEERIIYLSSDMNEFSIANVIAQLFNFSKRNAKKPIYLVISSYGGEIDSMFALYDALKLIKAPVHTIALGKVMSAGVLILASGTKGKRSIGANCRIMMHSISGVNFGNVFEQQNSFLEMNRLQKLMERRLAEETDQSLKLIRKIMKRGRDKFLTAKEAKKFGIVDNIIG